MGEFSLHTDYKLAGTERVNNGIVKEKFLYIKIYFYLFIYLFIYLAFSLSGDGHCYRFPQLQQALLYRFVVEEVTVHNTGISLLLSTSVWVLLSPPIECRETRPMV